jgi:hypothetical protein
MAATNTRKVITRATVIGPPNQVITAGWFTPRGN